MATYDEISNRLKRAGEQLLREFTAAGVTDSDGVFAVHIKGGTVTVEAVPVDERKKTKGRNNAVESDESVPPASGE